MRFILIVLLAIAFVLAWDFSHLSWVQEGTPNLEGLD